MTPAAASAPYSPRLRPAVQSARSPFSSSTFRIATSVASMAIWVYSVMFRLSFSVKQSSPTSRPAASPAVAYTLLAVGKAWKKSFPIPQYWAPCPGKINAVFPISIPLSK